METRITLTGDGLEVFIGTLAVAVVAGKLPSKEARATLVCMAACSGEPGAPLTIDATSLARQLLDIFDDTVVRHGKTLNGGRAN